jgi:hypothetical protein
MDRHPYTFCFNRLFANETKDILQSRKFIRMNTQFVLSLLLVTVVLFLLLRVQKAYEPFAPDLEAEMKAMYDVSRDTYIETGKKRYNRFSDPMDVFRPGITRNMTPEGVQQLDKKIYNAIVSKDLLPADPFHQLSKTGLAVTNTNVQERLPPESILLKAARKCETQLGRDKCSILGTKEYALCGVCIKEGTDVDEKNKDTHIGGLLVIPKDREMAEKIALDENTEPIYQATTGSCPPGFLFVDRKECEKAVNRQNCKEIGTTGGFDGGKTIEGKKMDSQGISCAACPISGPTTFIYENPEGANASKTGQRIYNIRLRAITPSGTGRNSFGVYGKPGNTTTTVLMASAQALGGNEVELNINGVYEGQHLEIKVIQEFPHRPVGKVEVFIADREGQEIQNDPEMKNLKGDGWAKGVYGFTKNMARNFCERIGTTLATADDLNNAYENGAQVCRAGHLEGAGLPSWPSQAFQKDGWCGTTRVNTWHDIPHGLAGAWCKGIKPPIGTYKNAMGQEISIYPWFMPYTFAKGAEPSQEDMITMNSQHGIDYQAPNYRGVCLQWETRVGDTTLRRLPVEPSIVAVMGQNPRTVTSDGQRLFNILRRFGTFHSSRMIASPKPAQASSILPNQFWIWNNMKGTSSKAIELSLTVEVPGIFANPQYVEDIPLCPRGPIVKTKNTLALLRESPCAKDGQAPGKYSIECLTSVFIGAGGDSYMGKLSPLVSSANMDKLRFKAPGEPRDLDEMMEYLLNLYSIASTGRDSNGILVGKTSKERRTMINEAGQAMLGIDIVSPCEEVKEDEQGNILLVAKQAPFDADCMDYLYTNAGKEDLIGGGTAPSNSKLGATYTNIADRFSGLRSSEKDKDREKHPFMACQRTGTLAPIDANGKPNNVIINRMNALAMAQGGSAHSIQKQFNDVYQLANKSLDGALEVSKEEAQQQQAAVQMCYGIDKAVSATSHTGCGVMARFVRVLRPQSGIWSRNNLDVSIQISQIQVFDGMGNELAKNKPTTTYKSLGWAPNSICPPKNAVDGNAFPRSVNNIFIDEYSNDDYSQFWMVDLGDVYEIRKVAYFNRTDCCNHRSLDMPIQLLDADKKVVAQQLLSEQSVTQFKETLEFSKADVTIPIPIANIVPGINVRFRTAVMHSGFLVPNQNKMASCIKIKGGDLFLLEQANFAVRKGLNEQMGAVSFESVKFPGLFLTAVQGSENMFLAAPGNPSFASFVVRPALNGAPSMVSLECFAKPGFFVKTNNRQAEVVTLQNMAGASNPHHTLSACFQIERV